MEDDRDALPHPQPGERRPELVTESDVRFVDRLVGCLGGLPLQGLSDHALVPEVRVADVDHGAAQVRVERLGHPQVAEPARDPDEGLLRDVLGEVRIRGDEVGEPDRRWCVALVELGEALRLRPALLGYGRAAHPLPPVEETREPTIPSHPPGVDGSWAPRR